MHGEQKTLLGFQELHAHMRENIERGRMTHGYCIVGSLGIGKRTFIRAIAEDIFALRAQGAHPDYYECPEEEGRVVTIATVRGLTARASLRPSVAEVNVLVLQNIDRCTKEAANGLLKLLEDPPSATIIFCTAEALRGILPTLRSRLQFLCPRPVSKKQLQECFPEIPPEAVRAADGRPGLLKRFAGDTDLLASTIDAEQDWNAFFLHPESSFGTMRTALLAHESLSASLSIGTRLLRDRMLASVRDGAGERRDLQATIRSVTAFADALALLKTNASKELIVDNLLLACITL